MKNVCKAIVYVVMLACLASTQLNAKETESYRSTLERYLSAGGTAEVMEVMLPTIIDTYKQQLPSIPDEIWIRMEEKMHEEFLPSLAETYEPIFQKYLTQKDLQQIIKFYETPVGKKLVAATPALTQESFTAGSELGRKIGMEIVQELIDEGFFSAEEQ
ncbi:MAG: DUF2059 domain-containing protein [Treponema sp.]|nr:DUF2059 domain-containing protein [Treponema sp.]